MAQGVHVNPSLPEIGSNFLYKDQNNSEKSTYTVETPYGFQLDLDFLKYVDDIQSGQTLKKVPVHRKPKVPKHSGSLWSPSSQTGGWTSTESLASTTSEDGKYGVLLSPRGRTQSSSSDAREPSSLQTSSIGSPTPVIKLLPPPSPKSLIRNARVEKTLLETSKRLEQEQLNLQNPGDVQSRPRLPSNDSKANVSVSSSGFSHVTQLSSSVPQNGGGEGPAILSPSFLGSVRISPLNSGRSTPATTISPVHLQYVREQMAAALKQLRELEEQVKTIPVLEQKVSTLKKEKEKLLADLQKKETIQVVFRQRSYSADNADKLDGGPEKSQEFRAESCNELELLKSRTNKVSELRKLTERLSVSERNVRTTRANATRLSPGSLKTPSEKDKQRKSVAVGAEVDMNEAVFYYRSQRPCQDVAVGHEIERKDVGVWVMESLLGLTSETEREIELLQHTIDHQRDVVSMLEGHLKEATEELEKLRVEVCSRRSTINSINKEVMARPELVEAYSEARVSVQNQAVGNHVEMREVAMDCSPQMACVAISCNVEVKDVAVGPDLRIEYQEKCIQVSLEPMPLAACASHDLVLEGSGEEVDVAVSKAQSVVQASLKAGVTVSINEAIRQAGSCDKNKKLSDLENKVAALRSSLGTMRDECLIFQNTRSTLQVDENNREGEACAPLSPLSGSLKSIMKKKDGTSVSETAGNKKSLKFVGVLNGEYESTSSEGSSEEEEDSSLEKVSLDSSDSDGLNLIETSEEELNVNLHDSDSDLETLNQAKEKRKKKGKGGKKDEASGGQQADLGEVKEKFQLNMKIREACLIMKDYLHDPASQSQKNTEAVSSTHIIQQEWFRVSSQKSSHPGTVSDYLTAFAEISPAMLAYVVNLVDANGNTALHYSVSHSNFQIVKLLLDTDVCNVDRQNKAGYTAIMLTALATVEKDEDMQVVRRLFSLGNVNAKASQAGQTALMLAVSHGRQEMVQALLMCGASVNVQDDEGSTALMCASEHGRLETVKLLLAQPGCDVFIMDSDGSSALSVAVEAEQKDIATLLYAHMNTSRTPLPQETQVLAENSLKSPLDQEPDVSSSVGL
ncbi:LOW QUALITY PROTEIN: KN motif and ankyrin repeat domain-containing protein 1-like [Microcaecilia unicolor]|uniref:LOW QUALITY PROTEIN: KN motif and ankyrin repeat domain-containing protein 1-like n=1 Tax=Microcaecilia unicolor TaxID=1415580 RepID=A0A6P7ZEL8_9AMPH|nr:LOW QUALITY PROTEIN: KN motif and ankyrin repeat domain-containing protein 1-like [Microcaecilia unicolor]